MLKRFLYSLLGIWQYKKNNNCKIKMLLYDNDDYDDDPMYFNKILHYIYKILCLVWVNASLFFSMFLRWFNNEPSPPFPEIYIYFIWYKCKHKMCKWEIYQW